MSIVSSRERVQLLSVSKFRSLERLYRLDADELLFRVRSCQRGFIFCGQWRSQWYECSHKWVYKQWHSQRSTIRRAGSFCAVLREATIPREHLGSRAEGGRFRKQEEPTERSMAAITVGQISLESKTPISPFLHWQFEDSQGRSREKRHHSSG